MSKEVRFRRGTTAQHTTFTGVAGELTVDTDKDVPVVHNGTTPGGVPLLRKDRPRGMTKMEIFTSNGTWTSVGKTDLKRIRVTCYGGGAGGGSDSGGGGGGISQVVLELSDLTASVAVTIGAGGGSGAGGGTTSFGSYISASGGQPGSSYTGGAGGTSGGAGGASGNPVYLLGGQGTCQGESSLYPARNPPSSYSISRMTGGGFGGGRSSVSANGVRGGGGGKSASGTGGSVIVEEFYGFV